MTDQVTIKQPEATEDPAHVAAMVAKVDGASASEETTTTAPETPAAERPAWLPEKFKSAEDMAAAYAALEAKQGGKEAETPAPELNPDGTPKTPEGAPKEGEAEQVLADKGLSFEDFSTEFAETGALSADSYAKLEKAGIPKAMVDSYIAGQTALAASYEADVKSAAGGAEQFDEVTAWAAANLTDAEKIAYNKAIDSGDIAQAKLAVAGLKQKFDTANPTEGNLLAGRFANGVGESYESTAQMTADMSNPLYKTDPAFRKKVQDKIARSSVI